MRVRLKQWWAKKQTGGKLLWLTSAALFCMLLCELLCNARAFATRGLTPTVLPAQQLPYATDLASVFSDENGVHVSDAASHSVDFTWDDPQTALETASVTLTGGGVVRAAFFVTDEASAYGYKQVYSVTLLPGDGALGTCVATVHSEGVAGSLMIRLMPQNDDAFTVAQIAINLPVPFTWQPFRMALSFAAALALLCALFLRGAGMAYQPEKISHRVIVVMPLAGLMVFALVLAGWIAPDTPLFTGITDKLAAQSRTDTYAVLYETLRSGRLSVPREPDDALSTLENPYDQTERVSKGIDFAFDYAYYDGEYYIYYGVAPVLTIYAPYHLLTGRVPTSRAATLLMGWLAIALIGWAVCALARRYLPGVNIWALALGGPVAVFASGAMFLLASADFYYLAELSFVCFAAGSIGFGLHASLQTRRWLRYTQYLLSGVCFALAAMSRPSAVLQVAAMLAPVFIALLIYERARFADAAAFLVPALLGVGALLWYNAARFGSIFDFGAAHQLTVADMRWQTLRWQEWPQALYHYLLEPLGWTNRFPYLTVSYHALPAAGRYVFALSSTGVLAYPVTWAILFYPLAAARFPAKTLARERKLALFLPLLASLPLMLLSYNIAGAILRYTCDFRLFYALAGCLVAMALLTRADTPERRAIAAVCALLCVFSLLVGFGMLFDNERDYIAQYSPQIYYGLQRMFFPY